MEKQNPNKKKFEQTEINRSASKLKGAEEEIQRYNS